MTAFAESEIATSGERDALTLSFELLEKKCHSQITSSWQLAACVKKRAYGRVVSVQSNEGVQELTQTSGRMTRRARRHWPLVTAGVDRTSFKMNPVRMAAGIKIRSAKKIFTFGAMHDLRHLGKVSSFKFFRDRSYHFVIALWRANTAESPAL